LIIQKKIKLLCWETNTKKEENLPQPLFTKRGEIPLNLPSIKGEVLNLPQPLFTKRGTVGDTNGGRVIKLLKLLKNKQKQC